MRILGMRRPDTRSNIQILSFPHPSNIHPRRLFIPTREHNVPLKNFTQTSQHTRRHHLHSTNQHVPRRRREKSKLPSIIYPSSSFSLSPHSKTKPSTSTPYTNQEHPTQRDSYSSTDLFSPKRGYMKCASASRVFFPCEVGQREGKGDGVKIISCKVVLDVCR